MELPQPSRPYATEGRKTTHDFLSLYSHSPAQQDPRPSSHGGYLKTHNFLQPLEKEDKKSVKENNSVEINVEKPPPPAQASSGEHVLHGGIGTYSISHIPCFNPRMPKPEGSAFVLAPHGVSSNDRNDDNSNCSSYTAGSSFTLWEEPSTEKGQTEKENLGDQNITKEQMVRAGNWTMDRPSESSSNHRNSFSNRSCSQPPAQKSQSFMEMLNSAEGLCAKEEDEDEEGFTLRKDTTSQTGDLKVKIDGKGGSDQKANTPRSKHSATEQRRRCKINDRFLMLRQIIPNSDQKRDKASFLLEVIEYIQQLQEKVSRFETPHPSWSSELGNLSPWRSSPKLAESLVDRARGVNGPALMFKPDDKTNVITSTVPRNLQNPADSNANNSNKAAQIPIPLLTDNITGFFPSLRNNNESIQPAPRIAASHAENASLPQPQLWQGNGCSSDFVSPKSNQETAIEGGTINISSMYSQGLLNTLTQALKSSGVDLSQATVSVQVDIGKRVNATENAQRTPDKEFSINNETRALMHERVKTSRLEDSNNQAAKRLKTVKS